MLRLTLLSDIGHYAGQRQDEVQALKALVTKSQGGKFGARDLRRVIRKAVEDPAAERLIDGTLASGSALTVDADADGEVVLK